MSPKRQDVGITDEIFMPSLCRGSKHPNSSVARICNYLSTRARTCSRTAIAWRAVYLLDGAYFILVYLIFFLVYTPIDMDHVRGIQGRYFVIALPVAAVFIAALLKCELPYGVPAAIAIAGSMIAGITTVEAVLRPHW
jgi:hypothetical protein